MRHKLVTHRIFNINLQLFKASFTLKFDEKASLVNWF